MVISALSIVVITVIVCAEVFLRTAVGVSTLISAEYAGYLLAANVYLGLAWTFRNGGFIRVELIHSQFRGRAAALINLLITVIATATLLVYTWYIIGFVVQNYRSGATSIFITRTVLWVPQLVMPIGSVRLSGVQGRSSRPGLSSSQPTSNVQAISASTMLCRSQLMILVMSISRSNAPA